MKFQCRGRDANGLSAWTPSDSSAPPCYSSASWFSAWYCMGKFGDLATKEADLSSQE
jgi:hypothetical protein